jgi:hypothetical protein
MVILPTDIRILFTTYDIIAYFLNLSSCSEHFISIKHRILETFNINKKNQFFKESSHSFNDFFGRYKHIMINYESAAVSKFAEHNVITAMNN